METALPANSPARLLITGHGLPSSLAAVVEGIQAPNIPDSTEPADFLCACVGRTVEHDPTREIHYLRRNDETTGRIMDAIEMPDRLAETS